MAPENDFAVDIPTGPEAFASEGEMPVDADIDTIMAGITGEDFEISSETLEGDTPESEDDYVPPTREEWEAAQQKLGLIDVSLEEMLTAPEADPEPVEAPINMELIEQKQFEPAPELLDKILVDGDTGALIEFSKQLIETIQHNYRLDMSKAVLYQLNKAQPVYSATTKFYERYPELLGARELVERNLWAIREQYPQANEMQILRFTEQRLAPVIERAKQIAKQAGIRGSNKNLSPKPATSASPGARMRQTPGAPKAGVDIDSRLAELREYASQ